MTDAELADILARAAAATQAHNRLMLHAGYMHDVSVAPVTEDDATVRSSRDDVPALVAALRELRMAARAAVGQLYAIDPLGRYCCVCEWYAERGHKDDCPVGALAALVGEGRDG